MKTSRSETSISGTRGLIALATLGAILRAGHAVALVDDPYTTRTQPSAALLMPFDQTAGHASFLLVSNPWASSGGRPAVTTHWSFWGEDCSHLGDFESCLTEGDTTVIDPSAAAGLDASNTPLAAPIDLAGKRGFVTVTAYETDSACSGPAALGYRLVDGALVGTATVADLSSESSYGFDAVGLFADSARSRVNLPDFELSPDARTGFLAIQTYRPDATTDTRAILVSVEEGTGMIPGEIGPGSGTVTAEATFFDNLEVSISLPDVAFRCSRSAPIVGGPQAWIPEFVGVRSAGVYQLRRILTDGRPVGFDTFVYGFVGEAVDRFGASWSAKYPVPELVPTPTPGPTTTPTPFVPTPTPGPTATPGGSTPTPGGATPTPTPDGATPTPTPDGATPTPTPDGATPTPTPGGATPTPTPGGATPTPTPGGATPTPTPDGATPTPTPGTGTPTPTPAVATPTPVITPTPTVTPGPTGTPAPGCTKAIVTVATSFASNPSDPVSGVTTALNYPETKVLIPGSGNSADVLARVQNLTGVSGGLFSAGDDDSILTAGLVSIGQTIPSGNFVRVTFDCIPGQSPPSAGDFGCTPTVSTLNGFDVPASCLVASLSLQ